MLFNSVDFAIFLPIVFTLYWLLHRQLWWQNAFLAAASYLFYGWWDWRFTSLLFFSSLVDYSIGLALESHRSERSRSVLLAISLVSNLGLLGIFKYFNFFLENFKTGFSLLGYPITGPSLNIILPVGISFYTFQTLSYTIDVYRGRLKPTRDLIAFLAFVSFFPQLVAGPIERASSLLPQFQRKRLFSYQFAVSGLRQMLWGFFKKVVVADNCAPYVNTIFGSQEYRGSTLLLGLVLFSFQIYGDFSGYSDIATGVARLFGFRLMPNFSFPYFSRDVSEFWRRWHISLMSWFRDYVYFSLGGARSGRWRSGLNVAIVFLISGFWHGANWTFVLWGILNAFYVVPYVVTQTSNSNKGVVAKGRWLPSMREFAGVLSTFLLVSLSWILFRSPNLVDAWSFFQRLFDAAMLSAPQEMPGRLWIWIFLLLTVEWAERENEYALERLGLGWSRLSRWSLYFILIQIIFLFGGFEEEFIYFQF